MRDPDEHLIEVGQRRATDGATCGRNVNGRANTGTSNRFLTAADGSVQNGASATGTVE